MKSSTTIYRTGLLWLVSFLFMLSASAQDSPKSDPLSKDLRLTGEWEVFINGGPTGILLDLRQISSRVHGNYGAIKPNEKLGIRQGQEFFRATIQEARGKGQIMIRKPGKKGKGVEKVMAPFRFVIKEKGDLLECEIGGDQVKKKDSRFTLKRIARVKALRLYVKTPHGYESCNKIVQDMPMIVEVELTSPSRKPFPITLKSGTTLLKLTARHHSPEKNEGKPSRAVARTKDFLPTFGNQLGVAPAENEKTEEDWGRAPNADDWKSLEGVWRSGYVDRKLGKVTGWIEFDAQGKGTFKYQYPNSKSEKWGYLDMDQVGILAATESTPLKWKIKFSGSGVTSEKVESIPNDKLKKLLLDPAAAPVLVSHLETKANIEIQRSDIADYNTLMMELEKQPNEDLMIWKWSYKANRETERDRNGVGRVGVMQVEDPNSRIGVMTGTEAWMKNKPNIIASFCTDNQTGMIKDLAYDSPVPRYRYKQSTRKTYGSDGKVRDEVVRKNLGYKRELFVVVTDLPETLDRAVRLRPAKESGILRYKIIAKGTEDKFSNSAKLKEAWKIYRTSQDARKRNVNATATITKPDLESMSQSPPLGLLVHAFLKEKTDPGTQQFTIDETVGEWKLQFGDTIARPEWLRKYADADTREGTAAEWEPIAIAYRPETVQLSLVAQHAIKSQEVIYGSILKNGKRIVYEKSGDKPNYKIPLKPDPREKNRYLSPPIYLVSPSSLAKAKEANPSGFFITCDKGETLTAEFQSELKYTISPAKAQLTIAITPAEMNALWKEALKKAADAAGKPIDDWDALARGEAEEVTNYILTNIVVPGDSVAQSVKISIGDHAAMLLLRDVFVEVMNEQLADWNRNQKRKEVIGIFKAQRSDLGGRRSPLSYYKIPLNKLPQFQYTQVKDEIYLYQIFDEYDMEHDYHYKGPHYALQLAAFSYAWRHYGADMEQSIHEAKSISVADIPELLKLTAYSFDSIVKRLIPRLMKLESDAAKQTQSWVPDRIARGYVKGLETTGAAIKAQADYSAADTSFLLTAASLVTIPLGNVGGFWSAMAVLGMSAVDLGHALYNDVAGQWDIDDQIRDEVAKGAALGVSRAAQKKQEKLATWQKALSVGGAGLGFLADGATALKAARALKSAKALEMGAEILKRADMADPASLRKLSTADRAVLKRVAEDAANLAKQGRIDELTEFQKSLLKNVEEIDIAFDDVAKVAATKAAKLKFDAAAKPIAEANLEKMASNLDKAADRAKQISGMARKEVGAAEKALDVAKKSANPDALKKAKKSYQAARKNSEVAGDFAGDLAQRKEAARKLLEEVKAAKKSNTKIKLTDADRRLLDMTRNKGDLAQFMNRNADAKKALNMTSKDRDMMRQISDLSKSDIDDVEKLIVANGGDWSQLKKLATGSGRDRLNMHRLAAWRRTKMNQFADDAIKETKEFLGNQGVKNVEMERNAFGSANLTSDYDVAIKGRGAELAVQNFNSKARKLFKNTESGAVVDTNLYTDPVYNVFKQADMTGNIGKLSAQQVDKARQFVFQQMANAKYRTPAQWKVFKENVLSGVPPKMRSAVDDMMQQAQGAKQLAERRIADKMESITDAAKNVEGNAKLRATNDLYGDALTDIHHYRQMLGDLDGVIKNGGKGLDDMHLPPALRGVGTKKQIQEIKKLLSSDATKARGIEELEKMQMQAALNIRSKQGEALYYASEAYQTRGTIGHVVNELQAGGQKVTMKGLLEGSSPERLAKSVLSRDDYINSFYENAGNMIKELNGKHIFDAASGNLKHFDDAAKEAEKFSAAGQKVAKYFERQLDAAAMAGVDMKELAKNPGIKKVMESTIALNSVRSDPDKFAALAKELMGSEKNYVAGALALNDLLERKVISNSEILNFAGDLASAEKKAIYRAADTSSKALNQLSASAKVPQIIRTISNHLSKDNQRFIQNEAVELRDLTVQKKRLHSLTPEQTKRIEQLTQRRTAIQDLNTQSSAAHQAGVPADQIDQIIQDSQSSHPDTWRAESATKINQALRQKTATTTTTRMGTAEMSPYLRDRIGLPANTSTTDAKTLSAQIKQAGKFSRVPASPLSIADLNTQSQSGRQALVMMKDSSGNASWRQIMGVTQDSAGRRLVQIRDAATGTTRSMPEALFHARSNGAQHQIIVDPFRNTDGNVEISSRN